MGTEITLDVGGMTIDYRKNGMGNDHGSLFQECDRKFIPSEHYRRSDYKKKEWLAIQESEIGFTRKLSDVVPRLEMLGLHARSGEAGIRNACGKRR